MSENDLPEESVQDLDVSLESAESVAGGLKRAGTSNDTSTKTCDEHC